MPTARIRSVEVVHFGDGGLRSPNFGVPSTVQNLHLDGGFLRPKQFKDGSIGCQEEPIALAAGKKLHARIQLTLIGFKRKGNLTVIFCDWELFCERRYDKQNDTNE